MTYFKTVSEGNYINPFDDQIAMLSSTGIALALIVVYWGIVEFLKSRGVLQRHNVSSIGPILMMRTQKGLGLLEKLAKNKRFWRLLANAGVPAVFAGMIFMFMLILAMDFVMFTTPPPPSPITEPRNMLLIPYINELFPPQYLLIGLVVTLIVHEFSHAILCRVEGVKVKALGVLFAIVPIGGFAEPDEEELMRSTRRDQRIRIFSAGVISNFIVAIIAFACFFYLLGFLSPHVIVTGVEGNITLNAGDIVEEINGVNVRTAGDVTNALLSGAMIKIKTQSGEVTLPKITGVRIVDLYPDYPAEKAGLKKGMVIFRIDGVDTPTLYAFKKYLDSTKPGQTIKVFAYNNSNVETYNVTLTHSPSGNSGFMGVVIDEYIAGVYLGYSENILSMLKNIPLRLTTLHGWLSVVSMPLVFKGFTEDINRYFESKILGDNLFYILNTLYWVGWINLYVGLFNCLPAIPLDGGRVFHEAFTALLSRRFSQAERISRRAVMYLAYIVFASIFLSFIIPNVSKYV